MRQMAIAVALLASACVVQPMPAPAYDIKREAAEQPVCKEERPTGSMILRRVCRTPEQLAADRAALASWGNRYPANPVFGDMTYQGVDARHTLPGPDGTYTGVASEPTEKPSEESKPAQ